MMETTSFLGGLPYMKRSTWWVLAVVVGSQALMWGVGLATAQIKAAAPVGITQPLTRPQDAPRIAVTELAKQMAGPATPLVIDLRQPGDYLVGHVPGSLNIPFETLSTWGGKQTAAAKRHPLVLYCGCVAEHSSSVGVMLLHNDGFADAKALLGSWAAWESAHQPIQRGPAAH